jgi:8-oxo-dGTP diphosphatase
MRGWLTDLLASDISAGHVQPLEYGLTMAAGGATLPEAVVGVLERDDRFLMVKRAPSARNPGWWGLPSGKVEPGETEPEAVVREMREELAIEVLPVRRLWTSISADGAWTTHWWEATVEQGRVSPARREVDDARWLTIAEVRRLGWVFPTDLRFFGNVWPMTAEVAPAEPADIDTVLHLRDEAADWMIGRGLKQWAPGELQRRFVQARVGSGQVFVMRRRGRALATVTITWSDEPVWGEFSGDAGYVHMLVVSSTLRGSGVGGWLLNWAEGHIAGQGHKRARLDCVQGNPALRNWYRERGYRQVGQRSFDAPSWSPVVLLEKELAPSKYGLGPVLPPT